MDSHLVQRSHLIFHKRDQRRDHDCNSFHHKCRHLITHRLSCSGRHDSKHIPASQYRFDHRDLSLPEMVIAVVLFQYLFRFFDCLTHSVLAPYISSFFTHHFFDPQIFPHPLCLTILSHLPLSFIPSFIDKFF